MSVPLFLAPPAGQVNPELHARMCSGLNNPDLERRGPGRQLSADTMDEFVAQLDQHQCPYVKISPGAWVSGFYLFRWNDGKMFTIQIREDGEVEEWYEIEYHGREHPDQHDEDHDEDHDGGAGGGAGGGAAAAAV